MEEVDGILLYTLKQIGCDLSSKIPDISSQELIQCILKCLELIRPDDFEHPTYDVKMPMSVRFRIAQQIAQVLTNMGYAGEIECQSLLYPTEADSRKILIFVVEKLPREADVGDQIQSLQSKMAEESKKANEDDDNANALPDTGNGIEVDGIRLPSAVDINQLPKETLKFYASHLAELTFAKQREKYRKTDSKDDRKEEEIVLAHPVADIDDDDFGDPDEPVEEPVQPDISESAPIPEKPPISAKPVIKPPVAQKPVLKKVPTSEEDALEQNAAAEAAARLDALREDTKAKGLALQDRQKELAAMSSQMVSIEQMIKKLENDAIHKEKQLDRLRKTHQLIDSDENGLEKLKTAINAQVDKLLKLSAQWETHRIPLVEQIRSRQESSFTGESDVVKTREKIKACKSQLKEMGNEVKLKEAIHAKLISEYEKMSKDLNRSSYTRRITEIIGNIKKQKKEIKKVLQDTKNIQKDINTLSGRLDRTFAVADELIFKDAEKDKNVALSYKLLVAIHSDFSMIIKTLEEAANFRRQCRDLEDKLELEKGKTVEDKLKRLRADITQMQKENSILEARLRDPTLERNKNK